MIARFSLPVLVALATPGFGAPLPDLPSEEEASLIKSHASSWNLVLARVQLRGMAAQWRRVVAFPDSASALYTTMLPMADTIVESLLVPTGLSRSKLMRWVEADAGLEPYFFPPHPESRKEGGSSFIWKILSPIVPVILYRVVDRMLD